jgi:hypothetical protein
MSPRNSASFASLYRHATREKIEDDKVRIYYLEAFRQYQKLLKIASGTKVDYAKLVDSYSDYDRSVLLFDYSLDPYRANPDRAQQVKLPKTSVKGERTIFQFLAVLPSVFVDDARAALFADFFGKTKSFESVRRALVKGGKNFLRESADFLKKNIKRADGLSARVFSSKNETDLRTIERELKPLKEEADRIASFFQHCGGFFPAGTLTPSALRQLHHDSAHISALLSTIALMDITARREAFLAPKHAKSSKKTARRFTLSS